MPYSFAHKQETEAQLSLAEALEIENSSWTG